MVNSMSVLSKAPWSIWGCEIHRNYAFFISRWHWENFKLWITWLNIISSWWIDVVWLLMTIGLFVTYTVKWVMCWMVVDLFFCWQGMFGRYKKSASIAPLIALRNNWTFNGFELSTLDLTFYLYNWFELSNAFGKVSYISFIDSLIIFYCNSLGDSFLQPVYLGFSSY